MPDISISENQRNAEMKVVHFETARALWRLALRFDLKPAEEKVFSVILFEGVALGQEGLVVTGSHRDLGDLCKFGKRHQAERARDAVRALEMHCLLLPAVRLDERGAWLLRVNFNLARWCAGQHCDVAMHVRQLNVLLAANGAPQWLFPPDRDLNSELPAVCREGFMDALGVPQIAEVSAKLGTQFRETGNAECGPTRARERLNVPTSHERNVETFSKSDDETIKRANDTDIEALRERVHRFVGEGDWNSDYWKRGTGWRASIFIDDYDAMLAAVRYCESVIGETKLRKTKGAMLWNEFRRRRDAMQGQPVPRKN
jgi:hypothetical protein